MRALALAALAALASCAHPPEPRPATAPESGPECGFETCAAGEFCEDRFKGHSVDDEGRPLEHRKCVPLPEACRATPTCACVTKVVSATHCSDPDGRITLDDYPE